jgi:hypothetical protein
MTMLSAYRTLKISVQVPPQWLTNALKDHRSDTYVYIHLYLKIGNFIRLPNSTSEGRVHFVNELASYIFHLKQITHMF